MTRIMICVVLFLGACSGGRETSYDQGNETRAYINIFREVGEEAAAVPELTPKFIDSLTTPTLEATVERFGRVALLAPYSERADASAGTLRVWRAGDGTQLIFRSGVLVATRGLGNDVGSTLSDAAVEAIQSRVPVSGLHMLYVKNGEHGISQITLNCEIRVVGEEQKESVSSPQNTIHMQSVCSGFTDRVTYDYWVDTGDSTVWRSRQWAGPELGYIRTRLLKK